MRYRTVLLAFGAVVLGACQPRAAAPPAKPAAFSPPDEAAIPSGPDGDAIRRGRDLFLATARHAPRYVGNALACGNCHLDAGRKADAAPMWAAWVSYPAFRKKNGRINTMADRIHDCFLYSMNAPAAPAKGPPPLDDPIYRDLQSYFAWLAQGVAVGKPPPGRGYIALAKTKLGHDPVRGSAVFAGKCAACHGADGQGTPDGAGGIIAPPLWGPKSFNWGAGMARVATAAGFIKVNMPFGAGNTLTDQQAWDVAAFIDSHERPRDPRQTGSIEAARAEFHESGDYYGQTIGGHLLGGGTE